MNPAELTTADQRREYTRLHFIDTPTSELAARMGVSSSTVCNYAAGMGLKKSRAQMAIANAARTGGVCWDDALTEMFMLMAPVMSTRQLSELLGVSVQAIEGMVNRNGAKKLPLAQRQAVSRECGYGSGLPGASAAQQMQAKRAAERITYRGDMPVRAVMQAPVWVPPAHHHRGMP